MFSFWSSTPKASHLMDEAAECAHCKRLGYGKGTCKLGHIHCRMCLYTKASPGDVYARTEEATGDSWPVYCGGTTVTVNAVTPTKPEVRTKLEAPPFIAPKAMFRSSCRMIEVVVGKVEEATTFTIHEPLLTSSSAYFERALKSIFTEGKDGRVELEGESPVVFGLLNEYIYTGNIDAENDAKNTVVHLSELWLLAHYLQMPKLLNFAMWRLLQFVNDDEKNARLLLAEMEDIYDKAPIDSMLRKLLVDLYAWNEDDIELSDGAPHSMLRDVIQATKKKKSNVRSPLLDVRNYYTAVEYLVPLGKEAGVESAV